MQRHPFSALVFNTEEKFLGRGGVRTMKTKPINWRFDIPESKLVLSFKKLRCTESTRNGMARVKVRCRQEDTVRKNLLEIEGGLTLGEYRQRREE